MFLFSFYPAQKEHTVFGPCRGNVGPTLGLCLYIPVGANFPLGFVPPSVKFPLGNSGFSGDLVGSVLYTLKGPSKVANCHLQVSQPHLLLFFVFILLIQARHKIMIENVPELGCLGDS